MELSLLLCLAMGVLAVTLVHRILRKSLQSQSFSFPPGPPPDPVIGNLRQLPTINAWKTYAQWSRTYHSDVISFRGFSKLTVVLNSHRAVADLFDKRGSIYSEREHNVMIHDLLGNTSVAFMPYNNTFRIHRKVMNTALNPTAVRSYYAIQEREAYALMGRLLETPKKWISHLRRTANSIILTMTYGHEVTAEDDYLVTLSERVVLMIRQILSPNSFLVNMLPALKHVPEWLPGMHFKSFAREGRKLRDDLQELPWKEVKAQIASGNIIPSYATKMLERKGTITDDSKIDEEHLIKSTAAVMYAAGSDTSVAAIITFILALVLYPDVQRTAQAEIDAVIGNSRLPTFSDQESLPYLQMVLAESLRWNPVSTLGIPHAVLQDDVYNGMFIPKGSVIMANLWALLHDPSLYPEPFKFWPERFDGRFPNTRHPRSFAFGFNRRLCPGRHLALNSLFIQAANLLAVYNFSKARDEHGNEIEPVVDYSNGRPKPFQCAITPRSDAAIALIRSAAAATST